MSRRPTQLTLQNTYCSFMSNLGPCGFLPQVPEPPAPLPFPCLSSPFGGYLSDLVLGFLLAFSELHEILISFYKTPRIYFF